MPCATISAMGVAPICSARSALITTTAAPPFEICDAFPAVIVPSLWKTGFSFARDSVVVPGRMPSSVSNDDRLALPLRDPHRDDLLGELACLGSCFRALV